MPPTLVCLLAGQPGHVRCVELFALLHVCPFCDRSLADLSWQNVIVQAQYFREVQHDAPSGLGRGSDRKVGGSTRSRSSTREKEEEEGE